MSYTALGIQRQLSTGPLIYGAMVRPLLDKGCTSSWQVLEAAGVRNDEVVYVEAHGTGTVAGDAQGAGCFRCSLWRAGRAHTYHTRAHWQCKVQHGPL